MIRSSQRRQAYLENWLIDPDFDEMGGELTFKQIVDPVPAAETEAYPGQYQRGHQHQLWQELKMRRHRLEWWAKCLQREEDIILERASLRLRNLSIRFVRMQLKGPTIRESFPQFFFHGNQRCNHCIPYNGRHTPNYWRTGQADPW